MSAAAPLQNLAGKPQPMSSSTHAGLLLQRKCACGSPTASLTGECAECTSKKRLQTKLAIGASNDPLEQEADRVADQVLAAPANPAVSGSLPHVQRLAGQPSASAGMAPSSVNRVLASPGRPLEPTLQQDMGQRFGYDFSRVRVHSGPAAQQSARDMSAHAYTVGHDIVFGAGRFAPRTLAGRRLIAHELTHVVQQSEPDGLRTESNEKLGLSSVFQEVRSDSLDSASAGQGSHATTPVVGNANRVAGRDLGLRVRTRARSSATVMRSTDPEPPDSQEFLLERPPNFTGVVVGSWGQSFPAQLVAQERLDTSFPEADRNRAVDLATALREPCVIIRDYDRLWIYGLGWKGLSAHFSRFTNASTILFLASPGEVEAGVYSVSNVTGRAEVEAFVTEDGGVLLPPGAGQWFLHTGGEFEEAIVSAGENTGAFLGGLVKGLSDANFVDLAERLQSMAELNAVFPLPFAIGVTHGIANEVVNLVKLLDPRQWQAIEAAAQQTALLLIDPDGEELAASLGEEVGRAQAASMDKLLKKSLVSFAYEVGKLVGPTIVEIVLAFLGFEIGPLAVLAKALDFLKKAPRLTGALDTAIAVFLDTPDIPGLPRRHAAPAPAHIGDEIAEPVESVESPSAPAPAETRDTPTGKPVRTAPAPGRARPTPEPATAAPTDTVPTGTVALAEPVVEAFVKQAKSEPVPTPEVKPAQTVGEVARTEPVVDTASEISTPESEAPATPNGPPERPPEPSAAEESLIGADARPPMNADIEASVTISSRNSNQQITTLQIANEIAYVDAHPERVKRTAPERRAKIGDGKHEIVETPNGCERRSKEEPIRLPRCPILLGGEAIDTPVGQPLPTQPREIGETAASEVAAKSRAPQRKINRKAPATHDDVWVNPNKMVYHLPVHSGRANRFYMGTEGGRMLPKKEAERLGYHQAHTPKAEVLEKRLARAKARQAASEGKSSTNMERVGVTESMLEWHGTDTPSRFARHQQSFSSLVEIMEKKAAQLAASGQPNLLPAVNRRVLTMPVDLFIKRTPALKSAWNALSQQDQMRFLGEIGAGEVGARVPDIAEFPLDEGRIVLIDLTEDVLSPLHRFKSDFYKEVMLRICGPRGPKVFTQDINPEIPLLGSEPR